MARKTNMRLLGVVENMTGEIFGAGGGEALAAQLDVPLLGQVPLQARMADFADAGKPIVLAEPSSPAGVALAEIAARLSQRLAAR